MDLFKALAAEWAKVVATMVSQACRRSMEQQLLH